MHAVHRFECVGHASEKGSWECTWCGLPITRHKPSWVAIRHGVYIVHINKCLSAFLCDAQPEQIDR